MTKNKHSHFAENKTFPFFFQLSYHELSSKRFLYKNKWSNDFFKNENPITLEIGCGKGEYTCGLAELYSQKNFIGLDIKGARMWRGAKTIEEKGLKNAAFIRTQAGLINQWFDKGEIDEIWITFPDPQPGARENKRLTSQRYLSLYSDVLKKGGVIHLKTDSEMLYEYTLETIENSKHQLIQKTENVYNEEIKGALTEIQTYYEKIWLKEGKIIKYISFTLNPSMYEGQ